MWDGGALKHDEVLIDDYQVLAKSKELLDT